MIFKEFTDGVGSIITYNEVERPVLMEKTKADLALSEGDLAEEKADLALSEADLTKKKADLAMFEEDLVEKKAYLLQSKNY